jgi:CheY-like chemotaxis protein
MPIPVLVVDDEPNFLNLMISVLGKRGFAVNTASNPGEALKLLGTEMFDFALVDLKLGGTASGIDLIAEIKRLQPRIHAVMVTAYPTPESRAEARSKGADAYLSKPLAISDLLNTLASVLTN